MEAKGVSERNALIDLESGNNVVISEHSHGMDANFAVSPPRTPPNGGLNRVMHTRDDGNQHMDCSSPSVESASKNGDDRKSEGEEKLGLLDSSGGEKAKKKRSSSKKPPRPPRPPTHLPLDASDQKLLNELNELALLKRARIERMKALKKMKNGKQGSSNSNFCPMIITIIFCLVILWQGFCSRQASGVSFHGSPESSVREHSSLISIRFYKKNHSNVRPHGSTSAAPKYVKTRSFSKQCISLEPEISRSGASSYLVPRYDVLLKLSLFFNLCSNFETHHRGWRSVPRGERPRHEHVSRA